jgi:hypothetical protein
MTPGVTTSSHLVSQGEWQVSTLEEAYVAFCLVTFSSRHFRGESLHVASRRMVISIIIYRPTWLGLVSVGLGIAQFALTIAANSRA